MDTTILSSTDYGSFKLMGGNRLINKDHLRILKKSIEKRNLLHYSPLIVNDKNEIVDGQHRFLVAQELAIPFYFIRANDVDLSDVLLLNASTKRWSITDYLESYIEQGKEDYVKLRDFAIKHHISISMALAFLSIGSGGDLKAPITEFKTGLWAISNEKEAESFANYYHDISNYAEPTVKGDRDYAKALYRMVYKKNILPANYIAQAQMYPRLLHRVANMREYLRQLEEVYNYKNPGRKFVRFV